MWTWGPLPCSTALLSLSTSQLARRTACAQPSLALPQHFHIHLLSTLLQLSEGKKSSAHIFKALCSQASVSFTVWVYCVLQECFSWESTWFLRSVLVAAITKDSSCSVFTIFKHLQKKLQLFRSYPLQRCTPSSWRRGPATQLRGPDTSWSQTKHPEPKRQNTDRFPRGNSLRETWLGSLPKLLSKLCPNSFTR